ncbi:MAG: Na(+)/H(+) antiporter subunit B [Minwuia sp.]|nr:Na(+)/H(+) antiporter subunit B [Minwuia sp.]
MIEHLVPRILAKLLIPFILLFGLYVQFHGDFGPGGGFQAGVIFAAGIILYALIYGLDRARSVVTPGLVSFLVALGLLIYAGVGVATMLLGAEFLNYGALDSHDPVHGQHLGILIIEFGVGTTVAAVMITIFYQFAGRLKITRELEADDEDDADEEQVTESPR